MLDGDGLIGDERRLYAHWQVRLDVLHGGCDVAPESEDVAALAHGDGEPDALFSIDLEHRLRGVGGAARDARDVAQTNHPAVRHEIDRQNVLLGPERARDADEDFFLPGLHHALRRDGVLGGEGGDQRGAVNPQARELLGRELHIDALVLSPEDVDLRDVRQLEELLADFVHVVPELTMGEPIGGEAIDDAVGVAELVVEAGADDALRQVVADVVHLLAHLIPDVRHLSRGRRILQVHEDRGLARGRVALQVVEVWRLLELALEAVGDLLERVADRGAGPPDLHDHGLDGEVRILAAPEPEVGPDARDHDDQHEIGHQRTMPDRPFGEVEAVHEAAPRRRTFWPGRSVCTPAVTTNSPVFSPLLITTAAWSYRSDLDAAQGHRLALWIDHPHGRTPVGLGERARRHLDAGRRGKPDAAEHSGSEPHARRRIGDPDLDLKRPGRGIRLGRNLPHLAGRLHLRVVGEGDLDVRVLRRAIPDELLGDVEDGVASALTRELHDHLPGVHDLARLGADRGDSARSVGSQHRVALLFPRGPRLRLSGVDLSLGGQELLLGLVEIGAGGPAILQELLLPREDEARLGQRRLGRGEIGFRRSPRVLLDLRIEPGDQLACGDLVADMNRPLDHPSVEAKSEADLVLRADLAGQRNDLAFRAIARR